MKSLLNDTLFKAAHNNVKVILSDTEFIPYYKSTFDCSGYFVDYGNPTLAIATKNPNYEMILCHESSHMDQFLEGSTAWKNAFFCGREAVDWINDYCNGESINLIDEMITAAINLETDCELRSIKKAVEYRLNINIDEEIQKANSYIVFYKIIKDIRKWYKTPPYQIKEVWSEMPEVFFDINYTPVPDSTKELYLKHCF